MERLRATDLTKSKIARETAQERADGLLYTETKGADGRVYSQQRDAELNAFRQIKDADATFYAKQKAAEADAYAKQKEAEGIMSKAKAYGELANVLGGPQGLMQYLMLENDTYVKLAQANGEAVRGMQPKISVWNTGEASANGADATAPIRNLMQSLPPLFSTISEQTGIMPPTWLARMPPQQQQGEEPFGQAEKPQLDKNGKSKALTNGHKLNDDHL